MSQGLGLAFIGAGGLAHSLAQAFHQRTAHRVHQVLSLSHASAAALAALLPSAQAGDMAQPLHPSVRAVVLCVPDSQIAAVAALLAPQLRQRQTPPLLLHTAGSVPLAALQQVYAGPIGVLYPLQTFTRGRAVDWGAIPLFLEASPDGRIPLQTLATDLASASIHWIDSAQRAQLHLGAVFAANFVNVLMAQAARLAEPLGLAEQPHRLYLPLLKEVVAKLHHLRPEEAQTGPARRGDTHTLAQQEAILETLAPELAELYRLMSRLIFHLPTP